MLQLYDLNKIKIQGLIKYKDLKVEKELSGEEVLSFSYPQNLSENIKEETYVRTKENEYVIKETDKGDDWTGFVAKVNIETIKGNPFNHYESKEQTCTYAVNLVLAGTGWTIGACDVTKRRTVRKANCSSYEILQEIRKVYRCDFRFNAIEKKIYIYQSMGSDKGVYFIDQLNLKKLDTQSNSHDFCTRIIPLGKDGLNIKDINSGKEYVENHQYSNKIITKYWEDNRYTVVSSLKEDAELKLKELSTPRKAYKADIIDLARVSTKYTNILEYSLGDVITLISKDKKVKEKQRIIKLIEYPDEPEKNSCEIANRTLTLEDLQVDFIEATDTVNSVTTTDGMLDNSKIDFSPIRMEVESIVATKIDVQELNAVEIRVGNLIATKASITDFKAEVARINTLYATSATIENLNATNGKITLLETKVGSIDTILSKEIFAELISAGKIVAGSSIIAEGAIGSAQINSLDVNKLNAGDISTSKIRIISADGSIQIFGNQILANQNGKNRAIFGEYLKSDGTKDYGLLVRAKDGTTIMLDGYGVHNAGLTSDAIKDNVVADNANISGTKLDINSVIRAVNTKGTETIAGTKVTVGDRTLDVELSTQKNLIDGANKELSTQKATINAMDNAIKLKVDNQTFTQYKSTTEGNISNINTSLNKATSSIEVLQKDIKLKVSQDQVDTSINQSKSVNYGYAYTKNVVVFGEHNLYYPIIIKGGNQTVKRDILITRGYSEQGPAEWNPSLATHHGGLTLKIKTNFGGWGGANYSWEIHELEEMYSRTFAGASNCGNNMMFAIFLRGGGTGGAIYHIYSDQPLDSATMSPLPIPPSPQVAYNGEQIFESDQRPSGGQLYKSYAPTPRTLTPDVEKEISDRKFIQLAQNTAIQVGKVDTKIDTKVSEINIALNGVTTRVGKTESASTVIDGKLTTLSTRVSNAEQKITPEGIVGTVTSSTAYKNDMDGKASQSALNTTTTQIKQLADLISQKVESKDFNSYKTQTDKAITDRVSNGTFNTYKTQTASEMAQRVSKGEFGSLFKQNADSFDFGFSGGVNLLKNSNFAFDRTNWTFEKGMESWIMNKENQYNLFAVDNQLMLDTKTSLVIYQANIPVKGGFQYTISLDYSCYFNVKSARIVIWWRDKVKEFGRVYSPEFIINHKNCKMVYTVTAPAGTQDCYVMIQHNGAKDPKSDARVRFANLMMVEGKNPANWAPHPSEFNNTSVTISDADGLVVRNNAISVVSKSGRTAFKVEDDGYIANEWGVSTRVKPGTNISVQGKIMADDKCSTLLRAFGLWHESVDSKYNLRIGSKSEIWFKNLADDWQDTRARWSMASQFRTTYNNDAGVILRENQVDSGSGRLWLNYAGGSPGNIANTLIGDGMSAGSYGNLHCGSLYTHGTKNRAVETIHFGTRALGAYETPTPYFGDISRQIFEVIDGQCIVPIDPIFKETITDTGEYQVFFSKYGPGDIWTDEMYPTYFIVKGANIKFSWELKAIQRGYENNRLEQVQI